MARDSLRNQAYREVMKKKICGKTVVEIGPGEQLVLTLMAVEAGATKVYAIEVNEEAYERAKAIVNERGLEDKIELIHGLSDDIILPEKVDVCLSEIIGTIGNSEGATRHIKNAKRFLKPSGKIIPQGITTWLSPVSKPIQTYQDNFLTDLITFYTDSVEEKLGEKPKFTLYEYWNFPLSHLIDAGKIFEEYWFDEEMQDSFSTNLVFKAKQNMHFDGLLLWISFYIYAEHVLGPFKNTTHWSSVYIPMQQYRLKQADVITVNCRSAFISSEFKPDYSFEVLVNGKKIDDVEIGFRDWV